MFCCACGAKRKSRNIVMLEQKALTPGKGWGCITCGLPNDGAVAVICDPCAQSGNPQICFVFDGYVLGGKVIPITELPNVPHVHNLTRHPEVMSSN